VAAKRILLVDDEQAILELGELALGRLGFEIRTALDGELGWEALQAGHFDLLVTDHRMPRTTGLELIKRVRDAKMEIPVVMVTGFVPETELCDQPELRPQALLPKPFTAKQLGDAVEATLRRS
jgi:DNA-binding response OmpR family regulator